MFAVIKTGGLQYSVAEDQKVRIGRIEGEPGQIVQIGNVLMLGGDKPELGTPLVSGASVAVEIIEQSRGAKVIAFKKRRRQNSRRKRGHRQEYTVVRISEILTGGAKSAKKAAAPKAAPAAAPLMAAPASGASDDISLIGGIGPKMEKGMRELGFNTFAAIAAMTAEDVARAEEHLKQKGRIGREEWIEQAKELLAGKPPRAKVDQAKK